MAITLDTSQGGCIAADPTSSATGSAITIVPRLTVTEGGSAVMVDPTIIATGVNGLTPTFTWSSANTTSTWGDLEKGFFSYDGLTWTQMGLSAVVGGGLITCQHSAPFNQNTVWFSRDRREGVTALTAWINGLYAAYPQWISNLTGGSNWVVDTYSTQTDELGRTVAATNLLGFYIKSGLPSRKRFFLCSGVHASEDWGTTCMRAGIEWLLGNSTQATWLRNSFDWVVMPLLNAPGREGGHSRAQFEVTASTHNDMNRHFSDVSNLFETVTKPRTIMTTELVSGTCVGSLDFHGQGAGVTSNNGLGGFYTGWGSTLDTPYTDQFIYCCSTLGGSNFYGAVPSGTVTAWIISQTSETLGQSPEYNYLKSKTDAEAISYGVVPFQVIFNLMTSGGWTSSGITVSGSRGRM